MSDNENKDLYSLVGSVGIPKHIAIIMDGNGRWAQQRGLDRIYGHTKGVSSVRNVTKACGKLGVKHLTLYSFSTENWNRPKKEIDHLMNLLAESIENELEELINNDIKLTVIGDTSKFPSSTQKSIGKVLEKTKNNESLNLIIALNYSSKWEIIQAVNNIIKDFSEQKIKQEIDDKLFETYLATSGIPNPELLIRTSGEHRISNFLLYQLAYAELYFTETYWPDFGEKELIDAVINYQKRERRFGKISEQLY